MSQEIKIGAHIIRENSPCFIIAEAGVNHNGSLDIAKQLIDIAATSGADAVKFQTYKTESLILEDVEKAGYQKTKTEPSESQTSMLKKLEIDYKFHQEIINHCKEKNIMFLSTCYDPESLELLISFNVPALKIASTDTTNLLLLEQVAKTGKPVILSTGMSTYNEIEKAFGCLNDNGCKDIILLKCTSNYPTRTEDVNLNSMTTMMKKFSATIGFSDHTERIGASPYAVAMGAKVVEKHFTIDKSLPGPDHQASLSPDELKAWVDEIRNVEKMLGNAKIEPTKSELETKKCLQKCLVSTCDLKKGETIDRSKIFAKRTGGQGISALEFYSILGRKVGVDIPQNTPITFDHLTDRKG